MTFKTTLAVFVLAMMPGLAAAQCIGDHASQTAMSCAEGTVVDEDTGLCVPLASS